MKVWNLDEFRKYLPESSNVNSVTSELKWEHWLFHSYFVAWWLVVLWQFVCVCCTWILLLSTSTVIPLDMHVRQKINYFKQTYPAPLLSLILSVYTRPLCCYVHHHPLHILWMEGCNLSTLHWQLLHKIYSITLCQALADIAKDHLASNKACSRQLPLRCPGCVNPMCGLTKEYFSGSQDVLEALKEKQEVLQARQG